MDFGTLANELTITSYGVFVIGAVAIGLIVRSLRKHEQDCVEYRRGFHEDMGETKERLTALETNVEWIVRNQGGDPVKFTPKQE